MDGNSEKVFSKREKKTTTPLRFRRPIVLTRARRTLHLESSGSPRVVGVVPRM